MRPSRERPHAVKRVLLSWSSGKDCAWALHLLNQDPRVEVAALLTTTDEASGRVAMHGTRVELAERQAEAAGVALWTVPLPSPCPNELYEARMAEACARAVAAGIDAIAFGDLFLEDVRDYRVSRLQGTGLEPLFPLWGLDTAVLAREMLAAGVRAYVVSVDTARLPPAAAGRPWDDELLATLPHGVDPCGENGEFHTFTWDSPAFARPVPVRPGGVVPGDGFARVDLFPAD